MAGLAVAGIPGLFWEEGRGEGGEGEEGEEGVREEVGKGEEEGVSGVKR